MATTDPVEPAAPESMRTAKTVALRRWVFVLVLIVIAAGSAAAGFGGAHLGGSDTGPTRPPGFNREAYDEGYNWAELVTTDLSAPMSVPGPDQVDGTCQKDDPMGKTATYTVSWLLGCGDFFRHRPPAP